MADSRSSSSSGLLSAMVRLRYGGLVEMYALVSCSSRKQAFKCPAIQLYSASALFRLSMSYCKATSLCPLILSAKHGVVLPEQTLEPYDESLERMSMVERRAWARTVSRNLHALIPIGSALQLHCGAMYCDYLDLSRFGVERPLQGLAIGQRLAWYKAKLKNA